MMDREIGTSFCCIIISVFSSNYVGISQFVV